ncbi:MAG TPA: glycerophosphoryl diester phosphodiesterase membrane domain-containing protein [Gaiellaceae bacterium]|nr:glycerophosphoryl diester phosphodiesterase membrane domain-containing protein [Gaiellaceae bacterium]
MSDFAVTRPVQRVELDAGAALKEAWRLYRRLFVRSVVMGAVVLGAMNLIEALAGRNATLLPFLALALSVAGIALLQGGLVEIVRGLHVDGDDDAALTEVLGRAGSRIWKLVSVSLLTALGVGVGFLLLVVPAFVLMTRWAVAVPVAMLEPGTARDAMRRSREIVRGNGWSVFKVLLAISLITVVVEIPFALVAAGSGPFGWWLATTIAAALTAPYAAHALTVVYYALVEPGRPVALEPGRRWQSAWDEEDA